ncbi:MAG TPA: ATP-binding protein [Chitinophagaceae bacterium]
MNRYFKYILLITFVTFILLIAFLQFNSTRSIDRLIAGNESLLDDLTVKTTLQRLQTDIITLESKVRGMVIDGTAADTAHLDTELTRIRSTLQELSILRSDKTIAPLISQLNELVDTKIRFDQAVLDSFKTNGRVAAAQMINAPGSKINIDAIRSVITAIEGLHQLSVTASIKEADSNGRKAKAMGTVMAILAIAASLLAFAYVTLKMRQQQRLIARLDSSEKKAREAAMIKEKFLANMSHEIRTPLNAILGYTNLLQRQNLGDHSKEYVEVIQRSGENLLTIVDDVLDLSKIEAGMMRIEPAPFSMRGLVHSIEAMFHSRAIEKDITLTSMVDEHYPDTVEGDPTRLTQILVNLIGNAIKFTEKGNIAVHVMVDGIIENTVNTAITITDSGIGIAKEKLEKIFERFQQAEDSATRKYGGTGLGLSIVNELVRLQKGSITVISELGKGTSFKILIPYIISTETARQAQKKNDHPIILPVSKQGRILVVEDNEINQGLLKHLLSDWKLEFDIAGNGVEAIGLLRHRQYELILMDIQMPEMDGYTTAQAIRNDLKLDTPIIAMTAHAMAGEREKCLGYGMNEYISKPIREVQLRQLIGQFINLQQPAHTTLRNDESPVYSCINLQYMKEVSGGDKQYERTVTDLFIDAIPGDLDGIEKAWQSGNISLLRQIVHNMRSSISIMGLNDKLDTYLDILEYENLSPGTYASTYHAIQSICDKSLEEAKMFLRAIA